MTNPDNDNRNNSNLRKADWRGNSLLVPLGLSVVFVVLAALMIFRNSDDVAPVPTPSGGAITQPSTGSK